jgi:phosphoglycolate phosphatase
MQNRPQSTLDAIFYDLDGTLADSCDGIEWAARNAIEQRWPDREIASIRHLIGPPIRLILRAALREQWRTEVSEAELDGLEASYRSFYDEGGCQRAALFPDVRENLAQRHARGLHQFVVTNKPQLPTRKMLQSLQIATLFEETVSPDDRAPSFVDKGEAALYLLQRHNLEARRVLFVGDARDDALAAQKANIGFIAAAWGYGAAATSDDLPRFAIAHSFADLDSVIGE